MSSAKELGFAEFAGELNAALPSEMRVNTSGGGSGYWPVDMLSGASPAPGTAAAAASLPSGVANSEVQRSLPFLVPMLPPGLAFPAVAPSSSTQVPLPMHLSGASATFTPMQPFPTFDSGGGSSTQNFKAPNIPGRQA